MYIMRTSLLYTLLDLAVKRYLLARRPRSLAAALAYHHHDVYDLFDRKVPGFNGWSYKFNTPSILEIKFTLEELIFICKKIKAVHQYITTTDRINQISLKRRKTIGGIAYDKSVVVKFLNSEYSNLEEFYKHFDEIYSDKCFRTNSSSFKFQYGITNIREHAKNFLQMLITPCRIKYEQPTPKVLVSIF